MLSLDFPKLQLNLKMKLKISLLGKTGLKFVFFVSNQFEKVEKHFFKAV